MEVRAPEAVRVPSSEREPRSLPVAKAMTGSSLLPVMVRVTVCWSKPPLSSVTRTVKDSETDSPAARFWTAEEVPSVPLLRV